MDRLCKTCGQLKPFDEYYKRARYAGGYLPICIACARQRSQDRWNGKSIDYRKEVRANAAAGKLNNTRINNENILKLFAKGCVDCSVADSRVLEFDHARGTKRFNISLKRTCLVWKQLKVEIDKCDVVCANCHKLRTISRSGSWRIS